MLRDELLLASGGRLRNVPQHHVLLHAQDGRSPPKYPFEKEFAMIRSLSVTHSQTSLKPTEQMTERPCRLKRLLSLLYHNSHHYQKSHPNLLNQPVLHINHHIDAGVCRPIVPVFHSFPVSPNKLNIALLQKLHVISPEQNKPTVVKLYSAEKQNQWYP